MTSEILASIVKPNPNIKIQMHAFLCRVFRDLSPSNAPKEFLKSLIPLLVKVIFY